MTITVDAEVDISDILKYNAEDVIEELEVYHNCFVFKYSTLTDGYKLRWFETAKDKYSLEEFEEKFPI